MDMLFFQPNHGCELNKDTTFYAYTGRAQQQAHRTLRLHCPTQGKQG